MPGGLGWEFNHALVREAIYERIPLLRRRECHQKVAEFLELQMVVLDPDSLPTTTASPVTNEQSIGCFSPLTKRNVATPGTWHPIESR